METVKRYPELYNYNDDWGNTSSNYQVYTLLLNDNHQNS